MNEIEKRKAEINSIMKAVVPKEEKNEPAPKKPRQKKKADEGKKSWNS